MNRYLALIGDVSYERTTPDVGDTTDITRVGVGLDAAALSKSREAAMHKGRAAMRISTQRKRPRPWGTRPFRFG
ncbi:hypothetical protein [Ensifer canadensis]